MCFILVAWQNFAAGNFFAGISCRLRHKIIRSYMDNNCSANDFFYSESVCQNWHICDPSVAEERRKIAAMVRVRTLIGIVMTVRQRKRLFIRSAAVITRMNMERKYIMFCLRQSADFRCYKNTLDFLSEAYKSAQPGILFRAAYICNCSWNAIFLR